MELVPGNVAVVTGAASGIGLALAERFAAGGMHVVLADVDDVGLESAARNIAARGVETLTVRTDVSKVESVHELAEATYARFGAAHVVCNNAGVASPADEWFGPLSSWEWVLGVNFWGVVHGVREFLPRFIAAGGGHIVNTASIAGLIPGFGPSYDASKHAVVALTEDLYRAMSSAGLPVGVSVLCPGWIRTRILDADRHWPVEYGDKPDPAFGYEVVRKHVGRAIDEGMTPAAVADRVADAIVAGRFWVFPNPEFVELAVRRWHGIAEGRDPELLVDTPGMAPAADIAAEVAALVQAPPT
jgi:NAD(P)-dependent dehydrogenase (short-subunit alcohol dehydrogenase family)